MGTESAVNPQYRVLADYEVTDPNPMVLPAGVGVEVLRKDAAWPGWVWIRSGAAAGWIPEAFLEDPMASRTVTRRAFNGTDLSAHKGALLTAIDSAPGWIYAQDKDEQRGWFPLFNLKPLA